MALSLTETISLDAKLFPVFCGLFIYVSVCMIVVRRATGSKQTMEEMIEGDWLLWSITTAWGVYWIMLAARVFIVTLWHVVIDGTPVPNTFTGAIVTVFMLFITFTSDVMLRLVVPYAIAPFIVCAAPYWAYARIR